MTGKGQSVAIVDAYASPSILTDANEFSATVRRPAVRHRPVPRSTCRPASDSTDECGAAAGTPRRPWTSSRSTARRPTPTSTSWPARAATTPTCWPPWRSSSTTTWPASSATRSASRPTWSRSPAPTTRCSRSGRPKASGSSSPPVTSGYESPGRGPGVSDQIQTDYPAASPWVTSVGGTSLAIGPAKNYEFETSWGTMHDPLAANGKSWSHHAARRLPGRLRRLQRRRGQHRLRAAVLPAGRGAEEPGHAPAQRHGQRRPRCGSSRTCPRWPTRAPGSWSVRPRCSRTARRTPSR